MDPCPFVRLIVESLAFKLPSATKPAGSGVHPSSTPCYAKLKIKNFPSQTVLLPLCSAGESPESSASSAGFHLDPDALRLLSCKPVVTIKISVFTGRMGRTCGVTSGKLLGSILVCVNLGNSQSRGCVYQNGWVKLGGAGGEPVARLHLTVRSEPDPRFVFQFGVSRSAARLFSKFREYKAAGFQLILIHVLKLASRVIPLNLLLESEDLVPPSDFNINNRGWTRTYSADRDRVGRERKGWMITVYDLSGSAVAAASMVTPFVPSSPGSDRVSRSNPGAWLILCPNGVSISSWKPWGRLEAWRERGPVDGLGYKFELITNTGLTSGVPIAEGTMSGICDGIERGRGRKTSKPVVQVGVQHVACMADAALFVALSAAMDLSMDACRLFSSKLRKEFSYDEHESLH
ncbi:hypothetical protein DH2020_014513 [Rehmannia glutinosa]|uniref:Uncharacterized protein n=1 Tax=Rehmannia glutinosa TaxID=99300 RepID=A0ABR0WY52_REHGL